MRQEVNTHRIACMSRNKPDSEKNQNVERGQVMPAVFFHGK
jgi:hypothetical protein